MTRGVAPTQARSRRPRAAFFLRLAFAALAVCGLSATGAVSADDLGGPAQIAVPSALAKAKSSFDRHARSWMAGLEKNEAENRRTAPVYSVAAEPVIRFDGYSDDFETQVKPTGHAGAPFVGILRYKEHLYTCLRDEASRCTVSRSVPVSEIFSFKNGRWTY